MAQIRTKSKDASGCSTQFVESATPSSALKPTSPSMWPFEIDYIRNGGVAPLTTLRNI